MRLGLPGYVFPPTELFYNAREGTSGYPHLTLEHLKAAIIIVILRNRLRTAVRCSEATQKGLHSGESSVERSSHGLLDNPTGHKPGASGIEVSAFLHPQNVTQKRHVTMHQPGRERKIPQRNMKGLQRNVTTKPPKCT